jgi:hypothetical protein
MVGTEKEYVKTGIFESEVGRLIRRIEETLFNLSQNEA